MMLINGDCLEEMKKLPNNCADLIFTSPPYWKGFAYESYFNSYHQYLEWTKQWTLDIKRLLKDDGWFILNLANDSETTCKAFEVLNICMTNWKLHDTIIWNVYNRQPANTERQLTNQTEYLFVFRKQSAGAIIHKEGIVEKYPSVFETKNVGNVWKIPFGRSSQSLKKVSGGTKNWGHSGFPHLLCELVIDLFSKENDTVLDCFGGTGIVGKVAEKMKRQAILIDKNIIHIDNGGVSNEIVS